MKRPAPAGPAAIRFLARTLDGVKVAPFPGFIEPCLATLRPKPPAGAKWQFEIKLDGYRTQIHWRNKRAIIFTRNGLDWTEQFAPIAAAAAELPTSAAVIDGEMVVQDKNGVPDFHALRAAIGSAPERLVFFAFDLLHLEGLDLRGASLADRRKVLAQLVARQPGGRVVMSDTFDGDGEIAFHHACEMGLEGIIAKRTDQPYRSGRVESWVKVKCLKAMRLAIVGFVPAKGNSIAALRLGRREGNDLVYAGKVGTGFSARSAQTVRQRLEPLIRKTAPLAKPLRKPGTLWVEPSIDAEIACLEMTDDGMVRHASFKGLKP